MVNQAAVPTIRNFTSGGRVPVDDTSIVATALVDRGSLAAKAAGRQERKENEGAAAFVLAQCARTQTDETNEALAVYGRCTPTGQVLGRPHPWGRPSRFA
jgi:hypothetical protein